MRTLILIMLVTFLGSGCDSSSLTEDVTTTLTVELQGVYTEPADAEGDAAPKAYSVTLQGLDLITEDDETISLSPESADAIVVIDRPQIVIEEDFADYEGVTFSSAVLTIDNTILADGYYDSGYELVLESGEIASEGSFSLPSGKDLRLLVKFLWQSTVTRDTEAKTESLSLPEVELAISNP